MKNRIYVIGMGPGKEEMMTMEALHALEQSDVIVGYTVYIKLLGERFANKTLLTTPMRQEEERCRLCFEEASKGHQVSLICSGDAGIYGLASLMYEVGKDYPDTEVVVIPGITAASSGAAVLGAPLNHDFCVISLSDLLTPWEKIEKRLLAAAEGDFAIAIYILRATSVRIICKRRVISCLRCWSRNAHAGMWRTSDEKERAWSPVHSVNSGMQK